ncbi:hypothetical protein M9H77_15350 [Catharanthus roseus]|uniref:Uncharacterized protein n=1 Tax=Catharanthus roseus TaxID=4058 RepID=A0ACC0AYH2_CATRO|nr:hypothetical protein M9H77_15350 [Catharanthus roseus]
MDYGKAAAKNSIRNDSTAGEEEGDCHGDNEAKSLALRPASRIMMTKWSYRLEVQDPVQTRNHQRQNQLSYARPTDYFVLY